ncbi:MAG: RNA polymerase sigma factor [Chthoniobacterales bacterium]
MTKQNGGNSAIIITGLTRTPLLKGKSVSGESKAEAIIALLRNHFSEPTEGSRNAVYVALKQRLEAVAQRIAGSYRMSSADVEDVVQESLRKFAEQEKSGSGIFDRSAVTELCPKKINSHIKGSVQQRSATWYRAQKRRSRIVGCSLDDTGDDTEQGAHHRALEYDASEAATAGQELCRQVLETVSSFLIHESDALTVDAIENAMTEGVFNTAELSRRHNKSQPTVWRQINAGKRRLRLALEGDGFGPPIHRR